MKTRLTLLTSPHVRQNMVVVYFPINHQLSISILEPLTSARSRHLRSGWMSELVNVVWYLFRYVKKRKKKMKSHRWCRDCRWRLNAISAERPLFLKNSMLIRLLRLDKVFFDSCDWNPILEGVTGTVGQIDADIERKIKKESREKKNPKAKIGKERADITAL